MTATQKMKNGIQGTSEQRTGLKKELLKFMEEECRPVKGIFKNYECAGGGTLIVQHKYPGQPHFSQWLQDGQEYEIPLWVARYLNGIDITATALKGKIGSCSYPRHSHCVDKNGQSIIVEGQRRHRFGFQSLEFAA